MDGPIEALRLLSVPTGRDEFRLSMTSANQSTTIESPLDPLAFAPGPFFSLSTDFSYSSSQGLAEGLRVHLGDGYRPSLVHVCAIFPPS